MFDLAGFLMPDALPATIKPGIFPLIGKCVNGCTVVDNVLHFDCKEIPAFTVVCENL